jgi:probable F420-dependent oxidoreductase
MQLWGDALTRFGLTVLLDGLTLREHRYFLERAHDFGYTDIWTSEVNGADGLTPLALASTWAPKLRLGTAVIPVFTRGPALLAQSMASLAEAAPGKFVMGLGTSSHAVVHNWNGIPFEDPYHRVEDTVRFLRLAMTGEKVDMECPSFTVKGFRLGLVPEIVPPIYIAAQRPGMLRLAGRIGDGVITNWLSAGDVTKVVNEVPSGMEIVARIFVCPTEDEESVRHIGRRLIAEYLNVPAYAEFHRWLGRGQELEPMWSAWKAGDRKTATTLIPDHVVDELIIHGSPDGCRARIQAYVESGVTTPVIAVLPFKGLDCQLAAEELAPFSGR